MADAQQTLTINLRGVDNASEAIEKVKGKIREAGLTIESAGAESAKLGERVNELGETGAQKMGQLGHLARPLAGFFGESAGEVRHLGHALHAVHSIVGMLPGPVAAVGLAVAAVGVGFALWKKHADEVREKMQKAEDKAFERMWKNKEQLAEFLGISREAVGIMDAEAEAKANLATAIQEYHDKQVALKKAIREGNDEEVESLREERDEIGAQVQQYGLTIDAARRRKDLEKQVADEIKAQTDWQKQLDEFTKASRDLAATEDAEIMDRHLRLRRQTTTALAEQSALQSRIAQFEREIESGVRHELKDQIELIKMRKESLDIDKRLRDLAKEGERHHGTNEAAKRKAEWAHKAMENDQRDIEALARITEEAGKRELAIQAELADDPAVKQQIRLKEIQIEQERKIKEIRDKSFASATQQTEALAAVERTANAERIKAAKDLEKANESADEKAKADRKKAIDLAFQSAEVGKKLADQMGADKKTLALLDAAIESAKAIAATAEGIAGHPEQFVAAAEHALAAAAFAAAAGGGASASGSAGSSASAAASASNAGATSPVSGQPKQPSHITVNFSRGFVFGSPHEIGLGLQAALKQLGGTGFAAYKGA